MLHSALSRHERRKMSPTLNLPHVLFFLEIALACSSGAFFLVRLTTPGLRGLGWVGTAFASAVIGTLTEMFIPDVLAGMLPDLFVLLAFVFLHVSVLELSDNKSLAPRLGQVLLLIEIVGALCISHGLAIPHLREALLPILLGIQVAQTAQHSYKLGREASRPSAWFLTALLGAFSLFSLCEGFLGFFSDTNLGARLLAPDDFMEAAVLLAFLGISMSLFWVSTTMLAQRLDEKGGTDPLTRALNRRHFLQWAEQERDRSLRSGISFTVLMVDIDHFKAINDTYGHPVGDSVICDVVDTIRDTSRGIDVIGRWGGEEFVVLLRDCSMVAALITAERLRGGIERMDPTATPLRYGSQKQITASIGVAEFRDEESIADLLARADAALYRAKESGRNCVVADVPGHGQPAMTSLERELARQQLR